MIKRLLLWLYNYCKKHNFLRIYTCFFWGGKTMSPIEYIKPLKDIIITNSSIDFDFSIDKSDFYSNAVWVNFIAMISKMANIDNEVANEEISKMYLLMEKLGLCKDECEEAKTVFEMHKNDSHSIYDYARELEKAFRTDTQCRQQLYLSMWQIAVADNIIKKTELNTLKNLIQTLNISKGCFSSIDSYLRRRVHDRFE